MDKNTGERREITEWHRIVFYRRQAEVAGEYLRKGSKVYVEGRLRTRKWQDQNGQDRYTTEIQGDVLQMLDSRADRGQGGYSAQGDMLNKAATNMHNPHNRAIKLLNNRLQPALHHHLLLWLMIISRTIISHSSFSYRQVMGRIFLPNTVQLASLLLCFIRVMKRSFSSAFTADDLIIQTSLSF